MRETCLGLDGPSDEHLHPEASCLGYALLPERCLADAGLALEHHPESSGPREGFVNRLEFGLAAYKLLPGVRS
jgi:hypothetical protein